MLRWGYLEIFGLCHPRGTDTRLVIGLGDGTDACLVRPLRKDTVARLVWVGFKWGC